MLVRGTRTDQVQVDISDSELFRALATKLEMSNVFFPSRDTYWEKKYDESGSLVALVEQTDISYHGSPCYRDTGRKIDDSQKIREYQLLHELKDSILH